jgi:hypothetical protein
MPQANTNTFFKITNRELGKKRIKFPTENDSLRQQVWEDIQKIGRECKSSDIVERKKEIFRRLEQAAEAGDTLSCKYLSVVCCLCNIEQTQ